MAQTYSTSATISSIVNSPTVAWGGTLSVIGGGEVVSASMQEDGEAAADPIIDVAAGGRAVGTIIRAGGGVIVSAGGTASNSLIEYNGIVSVGGGGFTTQSTITAGGVELVASGGLSTNATITGGVGQGTTINVLSFAQGRQLVISGGEVENSSVLSGGIVEVYSGGLESATTISTAGTSIINENGIGQDVTIQNGGLLVVEAGGTLDGATVEANGTLLALPGANLSDIDGAGTIITTGVVNVVSQEGVAPSITFYGANLSGGHLAVSAIDYVLPGGEIDGLTVSNSATIIACAGGSLQADTIGTLGTELTSGGIATNLTISGGISDVGIGGTNLNSVIESNGQEVVLSGGTASGTNILQGGSQYVLSGGIAYGTSIGIGGIQSIETGGTVVGALIENGGIEVVSSGGMLLNPTVQSGGILVQLQGGSVVGGNAITLQSGVLDVNKVAGTYLEDGNSTQISIESGHFAVAAGKNASLEGITVASGGTLDITTGASVDSVELDGGQLEVASGATIGSVTIEVGSPGEFTNAPAKDISALLNSELRSIPSGTSITVIFNPGDYGASGTIYLGSNTSVIGQGATLGAISNFDGNSLFANYDQQANGYDWTINNTDGSTTIIDAGIGGGALANVATITNDAYTDPTTSLQAETPIMTTEYAAGDTSTPIVDTNISISGMTLVNTGTLWTNGKSVMGVAYGSVSRGIWLTDVSDASIDNNVIIGGYSGMSLIDVSNAVVAQNVIVGSVTPIDMWSGPSNLVIEDNTIWEYSTSEPSGSTGAIQLNASADAYASDPGLNNSGTTTNDGLIGNIISGVGPNTSAIAVDPLYPYGSTSESDITEQENIDNALGNNTGGYYTANVQDASLTNNVYAGGSNQVLNTDSKPGTVQTSITTSGGIVSGNVVISDAGTAPQTAIANNNIDPTTVDNTVLAGTSTSAGSISTWGFTGTSTTGGNFVSGSTSTSASITPPIDVSSQPYLMVTGGSVQLSGTLSPEISDTDADQQFSVTLSATFGSLSSNTTFGDELTTIVNGQEALIIDGSESEVNEALANISYISDSPGEDDAIEITAIDSSGNHITHYIPILWNNDASTNFDAPLTITAGFIEKLGTGVSLTGQMVIASGGNDIINMGTTISAVFTGLGADTVNSGSGQEYIATGAGSTLINLGVASDITIVGGVGSFVVNGAADKTTAQALIEVGQSNASITGGAGSVTVVGGQGNLSFQGGSGSTFLATMPEDGGNLTAALGSGNSTVYALSGNSYVQTQAQTHNQIIEGYGNSSIISGGNDTILGGSGSLYVQCSQSDTTVTGGSGASTVMGGQANLTYLGGSGTTLLTGAASNGGALNVRLGTGNATVNAASSDGFIQTQSNTHNLIMAGSGNDTILSGGSDTVIGGSGSLYIESGQSDTTITGGSGASTVMGGQGNITYQGGSGTTLLTGAASNGGALNVELGTGNATVNASSNDGFIQTQYHTHNLIIAGSGNDTILSGGSDTVIGGSGSLYVEGGQSDMTITGGSGASTVTGGQGNLIYQGGSGATDIEVVSPDSGTLLAVLGSGNSTVNALYGNAVIQTQSNTENIISLGTGNATVLSAGEDLINAGSGFLFVEATASARDTVVSGSGQIVAENVGTNSSLSIEVNANSARINVGKDDAVTIGSSNNTVIAADNIIVNQVIFSGANSSNMISLGSNDFLDSDASSSGSNNLLNVAGDNDSGFISTRDISVVSVGGAGNLFVFRGAGLVAGADAIVNGSDTLSVWTANSTINAFNGATLIVVSGNNSITGSSVSLTLQGNGNSINLNGQDTVSDANPWSYETTIGSGSVQNQFTVQGGQFDLGGKDTLLQTNDAASITLAGGNSITLNGSVDSVIAYDQVYAGNNIILNGASDSVSVVNVSDSATTINAATSAFVTVSDDTGPKIGGSNNNSNERLIFIGGTGTSSTVLAGGSNTQVTLFGGSSYNNIVSGGHDGNNSLDGGIGGGDLLIAGGNNDVLIGGASGANTLISAAGNETLTGAGLGNDLFSIIGGGGTDMIVNFTGSLKVASYLSVASESMAFGALNVNLSDGTHLIFVGLTSVNQSSNLFTH